MSKELPGPASLALTVNLHGSPATALSRPGPKALHALAPPDGASTSTFNGILGCIFGH